MIPVKMQRLGNSVEYQQQVQQQRQQPVMQERLRLQQEAAATAHVREFLHPGASVAGGRLGLSHPLYFPLYDENSLQRVLQQQQQQQLFRGPGANVSSGRATYDQTADGRLLEDILNICPTLTPAATLVETKLANRALRLDTTPLQPRRSVGECAATAAATTPAVYTYAFPVTSVSAAAGRRRPLKLSRTQAKKRGLLDVRKDFEGGDSTRSAERPSAYNTAASATAAVPVTAAGRTTASSIAAGGELTLSAPSHSFSDAAASFSFGAAAAVPAHSKALQASQIPAAAVPTTSTHYPVKAAAASSETLGAGGGIALSSLIQKHGKSTAVTVGEDCFSDGSVLGRKLRYADMQQLSLMWLQYIRRVCGASESGAVSQQSDSLRTRGKRNCDGVSILQLQHHYHQLHSKPSPHLVSRQQHTTEQQHTTDIDESSRKASDRCMALSKAAWQGAHVRVMRSTSPTLVGLEGVVVEETQHSLLLVCPDQRLRRLIKHTVTLQVQTLDGSHFFLHPQHLQHSSAARSKMKFKPKNSLLL